MKMSLLLRKKFVKIPALIIKLYGEKPDRKTRYYKISLTCGNKMNGLKTG